MGEDVSKRTAFVKMDEFHSLFLLMEDGIPVDFRSSRGNNLDEFSFHIATFIEKLGIPPENVYCEGRGWANPLQSRLKRQGITLSDMKGSEDLRAADFEAGQAYHLHHLRQCAETLQEIEQRSAKA